MTILIGLKAKDVIAQVDALKLLYTLKSIPLIHSHAKTKQKTKQQ